MNEMRLLFAAIPVSNMRLITGHLQQEDCHVRHEYAADALALDGYLQQPWDVLIASSSSVDLTIETIVHALRCRKLDIPVIVLNDGETPLSLTEVMRLGAQDCIGIEQLDRLLPSMQREMVGAVMRCSLREQVVTDYLMQEIDQLILQGYDLPSLNERICRRMAELFEFKLVWIGAKMPDGRIEVVAAAGETAYLNGIDVRWDDTPQGNGPVGNAIRSKRPETLTAESPRFAP